MLPQSRPHAAAKKAGMYAFFLPKEKGDTDSSTVTSEQAPSTYEYGTKMTASAEKRRRLMMLSKDKQKSMMERHFHFTKSPVGAGKRTATKTPDEDNASAQKKSQDAKEAALAKRVEFATAKVKLDSKLEHKRALRETAEAKEKAENEKRLLTSQKSEKRYEYKSWQKEMGADLVAEFNGDATACVRWVRDPDSHLHNFFSPKVGTCNTPTHSASGFV